MLRAVKKAKLSDAADDQLEPVRCHECGENPGYGIEAVVSPVRKSGRFAWLRKNTKRVLLCGNCHKDGKSVVIAD